MLPRGSDCSPDTVGSPAATWVRPEPGCSRSCGLEDKESRQPELVCREIGGQRRSATSTPPPGTPLPSPPCPVAQPRPLRRSQCPPPGISPTPLLSRGPHEVSPRPGRNGAWERAPRVTGRLCSGTGPGEGSAGSSFGGSFSGCPQLFQDPFGSPFPSKKPPPF